VDCLKRQPLPEGSVDDFLPSSDFGFEFRKSRRIPCHEELRSIYRAILQATA